MNKELEAISAMFEEQKDMLQKLLKKEVPKSTAGYVKIDPQQLDEIRLLTETLSDVVDSSKKPQELIHRYSVDLKFMKNEFLQIGAVVIFVILIFIVHSQYRSIRRSQDNDLKYRFIEMQGNASPEDLQTLQEIFNYDRNKKHIKTIRQQVYKYERLVREQAEKKARAQFNEKEADRLKHEAEVLKGTIE